MQVRALVPEAAPALKEPLAELRLRHSTAGGHSCSSPSASARLAFGLGLLVGAALLAEDTAAAHTRTALLRAPACRTGRC